MILQTFLFKSTKTELALVGILGHSRKIPTPQSASVAFFRRSERGSVDRPMLYVSF